MGYPTPGTPERRALDRAMLLDPDRWPMGDRLPMKVYGHGRFGFVYRTTPLTVYETVTDRHEPGFAALRFGSVDELLDAGWTVD